MGPNGRLGNRLWTYANVLAFAMHHRIRVVNPLFGEFGYFAEETRSPEINGLLAPSRSSILLRAAARVAYKVNLRAKFYPSIQLGDSRLLELDDEPEIAQRFIGMRWVFLYGIYFSAPESMKLQRSALLEFFALQAPWRDRVAVQIRRVRSEGDVVVGIHLRKGDKRTYVGGIMYYSEQDIAPTMRYVADQLSPKRAVFMICSDEPVDTSAFGGLKVLVAENEAVVDMYALARCDYLLGPNSSFSQWASFYGGVPLHIVDWKTAEKYCTAQPVRMPIVERDFHLFEPREFARYRETQFFARDIFRLDRTDGSRPAGTRK